MDEGAQAQLTSFAKQENFSLAVKMLSNGNFSWKKKTLHFDCHAQALLITQLLQCIHV